MIAWLLRGRAVKRFVCLSFVLLSSIALGGEAFAAPVQRADGSKCPMTWVNNQGAMACSEQGEDDQHAGVTHPHYVACLNGEVFCCVDDNKGNQSCNGLGAAAVIRGNEIANPNKTMMAPQKPH